MYEFVAPMKKNKMERMISPFNIHVSKPGIDAPVCVSTGKRYIKRGFSEIVWMAKRNIRTETEAMMNLFVLPSKRNAMFATKKIL